MQREIFINVEGNETRVAIKEEGRLSEIHIERGSDESVVGNIYKGVVTDVLPGMEAAFVDVGLERNVFLHASDAVVLKRSRGKNKKINQLVQKGERIMVQIVKEPLGTKGARATCELAIPGRYLVLMANSGHIGVSRRISNEKNRNRLRKIVQNLKPDNCGLIVRTVAEEADKEELRRDLNYLHHQWKRIQHGYKKDKAPSLLYRDLELAQRVVRDIFTEDFERLVLDDLQVYREIIKLTGAVAPHLRSRIELYQGDIPIFNRYHVEKEVKKALERKVWLNSGGYLIIDTTEALTSVDVNTGKYVGSSNLDDTILKTNLEAAKEIPIQLKLRDIGGIIIIDFIDMEREKDQQKVMTTFQKELEKDKTKTAIMGLTKLGLVEMTRKKVKQGIGEYLQQECPHCEGSGKILTPESGALEAIHQLKTKIAMEGFEAVLMEVNPEVAALLIGSGGKNLKDLESKLKKDIYIRGNESLNVKDIKFVQTGSKKELACSAPPVKKGEILGVYIQDRHSNNPDDGIGRVEGYVIDIVDAGKKVGEKVTVKIEEVSRTFARARIIDNV